MEIDNTDKKKLLPSSKTAPKSESRICAPISPVAHLFSPLELRGVRLRNRIILSPMCQYSSAEGYANDWHLVHLGSHAKGGAAVVLTEAAAVLPEGRISPDDLGIWDDRQIEMLARIFAFIEKQGALPGMQLAHAGRKAGTSAPWKGDKPLRKDEGGWRPIFAPHAIPFAEAYPMPQALTIEGIRRVLKAFANAAQRALAAGSRILEIHAAHGYLLHEFLSPLSNRREDDYGGTFDNRTRILREVVETVRQVWPERYPLFVRISATDWVDEGWTIEDSIALVRQLRPLGVDLIDCSSGGIVPDARIPVRPGFQVTFAEQIRREIKILTGAVGLICEPRQADRIIRTGQADVVLLGRELLRDPHWPLRAAGSLNEQPPIPPQYQRAY